MEWIHVKDTNSPFPLSDFATCIIDEYKVYLFGGSPKYGRESSDIHEFDLVKFEWKKLIVDQSPLLIPRGRYGHTWNKIRNRIYLFGGKSFWNNFDDIDNILYYFDLSEMKWSISKSVKKSPEERYDHAACATDSLYIFGGYNYRSLNDFWKYDPNLQQWIQLDQGGRETPSARYGHKMCLFKGKIYLFGGCDRSTSFHEIWEYDLKFEKWFRIQTDHIMIQNLPICKFDLTRIGSHIYISGGETMSLAKVCNARLIKFSCENREVKYHNAQELGIVGHSMVYANQRILVFGGTFYSLFYLFKRGNVMVLDFHEDWEAFEKVDVSKMEETVQVLVEPDPSELGQPVVVPSPPIFSGGAVPPPPPMNSTCKRPNVRKVFFSPIPRQSIKDSVFFTGEIISNSNHVQINEKELLDQFIIVNSTPKVNGIKGTSQNGILDANTEYNIGIKLKSLKISQDEIYNVIVEASEDTSEEMINKLISICPTQDQVNLLKGYVGDVSDLSVVDQFLLKLAIFPDLRNRLECWKFKKIFQTEYGEIKSRIEIFVKACEEVQSVKFFEVLSIILAHIKVLNGIKEETGFKVKTLNSLSSTKSSDKTSLLEIIIKWMSIHARSLVDFDKDFDNTRAAATIKCVDLNNHIRDVQKSRSLFLVTISKQSCSTISGDKFVAQMHKDEFAINLKQSMTALDKLVKEMNSNFEAIAKGFCENPVQITSYPEVFFSTITSFLNEFDTMKANLLK